MTPKILIVDDSPLIHKLLRSTLETNGYEVCGDAMNGKEAIDKYDEFNRRQMNNLSKACKTIISTNIGMKELYEYYDERVASRIIGCFDILRFIGEDIRRLKKINGR
jgi:CheY-like chemotaxis protein